MSVVTLIQSLHERACRLESEACSLRAEASQLQTLFLGPALVLGAPSPVTTPAFAVAAPATQEATPTSQPEPQPEVVREGMPTVQEIRAKAAQYGVNVDDVMPPGKKPTHDQKQAACKKIVEARNAQEKAERDAQAPQTETETKVRNDSENGPSFLQHLLDEEEDSVGS